MSLIVTKLRRASGCHTHTHTFSKTMFLRKCFSSSKHSRRSYYNPLEEEEEISITMMDHHHHHPPSNIKREAKTTTTTNNHAKQHDTRSEAPPVFVEIHLTIDTSPSTCSDITTDTGFMILYGDGCESPSTELELLLQELEEGDELDQSIRSSDDDIDPASSFTENFYPYNGRRCILNNAMAAEPRSAERRFPLKMMQVPSPRSPSVVLETIEPNHAKHSRSIPVDQLLSTISSKRRSDRIKLAKHSKTVARLHRGSKSKKSKGSSSSCDDDDDHEPLLLKNNNSIPSVASTEPCSSGSSSRSSSGDNSSEATESDYDQPIPVVVRTGAVKRRIAVADRGNGGAVPTSYRKWHNCFQSKKLDNDRGEVIPSSYRKWRHQYQNKQIYCCLGGNNENKNEI